MLVKQITWKESQDFLNLTYEIRPLTLITKPNLHTIYTLVLHHRFAKRKNCHLSINHVRTTRLYMSMFGRRLCLPCPAAPARGSALKKLTKHLARCGCKYEVGCCSAVAARLNFVINQTLVVVCHIYGARVAAMCGNEPNKP